MSPLMCIVLIVMALVIGAAVGYVVRDTDWHRSDEYRAWRRSIVMKQMQDDLTPEQIAALRPHLKLSDLSAEEQDTVIAYLRGWSIVC
jgi:hypothetical protein